MAINRGAKRVIQEIVILADKQIKFKQFDAKSSISKGVDSVKEQMLLSGAWTLLRQRPFNVVADPNAKPKGVFISGFNSKPLGADVNVMLGSENANFQAGIDALNTLTDGHVHLGLPTEGAINSALTNATNVKKHYLMDRILLVMWECKSILSMQSIRRYGLYYEPAGCSNIR